MLKMTLLLVVYAITPIVGGRGLLPIGLVLFVAPSILALVLTLAAIGTLCAGFLMPLAWTLSRLFTQLAVTVLLFGAWLVQVGQAIGFNAAAEQHMALQSMLIFSIPFQIAAVAVVVISAVQIRRARASMLGDRSRGSPRAKV